MVLVQEGTQKGGAPSRPSPTPGDPPDSHMGVQQPRHRDDASDVENEGGETTASKRSKRSSGGDTPQDDMDADMNDPELYNKNYRDEEGDLINPDGGPDLIDPDEMVTAEDAARMHGITPALTAETSAGATAAKNPEFPPLPQYSDAAKGKAPITATTVAPTATVAHAKSLTRSALALEVAQSTVTTAINRWNVAKEDGIAVNNKLQTLLKENEGCALVEPAENRPGSAMIKVELEESSAIHWFSTPGGGKQEAFIKGLMRQIEGLEDLTVTVKIQDDTPPRVFFKYVFAEAELRQIWIDGTHTTKNPLGAEPFQARDGDVMLHTAIYGISVPPEDDIYLKIDLNVWARFSRGNSFELMEEIGGISDRSILTGEGTGPRIIYEVIAVLQQPPRATNEQLGRPDSAFQVLVTPLKDDVNGMNIPRVWMHNAKKSFGSTKRVQSFVQSTRVWCPECEQKFTQEGYKSLLVSRHAAHNGTQHGECARATANISAAATRQTPHPAPDTSGIGGMTDTRGTGRRGRGGDGAGGSGTRGAGSGNPAPGRGHGVFGTRQCYAFRDGRCARGSTCPFKHDQGGNAPEGA